MDHQFSEHDNVRMTRACKRGRKPQSETGGSGRGRRTRATAMAEMMQNNPMYGSQAATVPEHVTYSRTQTENAQLMHHTKMMQQNQINYQRRMRAAANLAGRQSSRYFTRAQNERASPYVQPEQNVVQSQSNQILYPNMVPRTTTTYSVPEQLPQLTTINEHTAMPRYNTRSAVHNLPLATAPTMDRYWNSGTSRSSVSALVQQLNSPTPVACPAPPQSREDFTQTELTITDDETKLIKLLRSKRLDPNNINVIIENDEYIVSFHREEEPRHRVNTETLNSIVKNSTNLKTALAVYCAKAYRALGGFGGSIPAIQYNACQASASTSSAESSTTNTQTNQSVLPSCALQNTQQQNQQSNDEFVDNLLEPESNAYSTNSNNNTPAPTMTSQPLQRNLSPNMETTFPIPTIFNHNFPNYNNFNRFIHQGRQINQESMGHRGNRSHNFNGPNFNIPFPFLQNFHPNMFMDPRFLPQFHPRPPDNDRQFGTHEWH